MGKVKDAEENSVENQVRDRARCSGGGHCYWEELTRRDHIEQAFQKVSEQIMVTQADALSLLNKYAEEKTSVLAVLVTS
jgi:hypothetical protein